MASKLLIALCTVFAVARAGNLLPVATYGAAAPITTFGYAAPVAPVAIHAPAVGSSHQSTLRSLDGNSAISHYSKSVDTAFSSVRKVDTRVTNDAKILTPSLAYAYSAPEHYAYAAAEPTHVISHTAFTGLGTTYAF